MLANNVDFEGSTYSIFLVSCPENCSKNPAPVIGDMVYKDTSSICKAAIHAGVLDDQKGGKFLMSTDKGVSEYSKKSSNGISGNPWTSDIPADRSFIINPHRELCP